MNTATLLADPKAIKLDCVRPSHNAVILAIKTAARLALCPRCHRRSTRIHSRYLRHVADLPWHGVSVRLELYARRFRCRNSLCPQRIFCERLPRVVGHYTRKSVRLQAALELIGFAVGGESGARITRELGLTVSPDTLLRRLRLATRKEVSTPRIIGVDDFAFRHGQRYGTLLVDLERHLPIDLLPDRAAETLSAWLKAQARPSNTCRRWFTKFLVQSGNQTWKTEPMLSRLTPKIIGARNELMTDCCCR